MERCLRLLATASFVLLLSACGTPRPKDAVLAFAAAADAAPGLVASSSDASHTASASSNMLQRAMAGDAISIVCGQSGTRPKDGACTLVPEESGPATATPSSQDAEVALQTYAEALVAYGSALKMIAEADTGEKLDKASEELAKSVTNLAGASKAPIDSVKAELGVAARIVGFVTGRLVEHRQQAILRKAVTRVGEHGLLKQAIDRITPPLDQAHDGAVHDRWTRIQSMRSLLASISPSQITSVGLAAEEKGDAAAGTVTAAVQAARVAIMLAIEDDLDALNALLMADPRPALAKITETHNALEAAFRKSEPAPARIPHQQTNTDDAVAASEAEHGSVGP